MSPQVRSTRCCRTSENRSRRWTAVLTIIAMLGIVGFVYAADAQAATTLPKAPIRPLKAIGFNDDGSPRNPAPAGSGPLNPLAAPANDDCSGAIVIPPVPVGSYPIVTTPVDVTDATPQGADEGISACSPIDYTVWYSFTPTDDGVYIFSTCFGNGATGSTVYDSIVSVFDSSGGVCPEAAELNCNDSPGAACTSAGGGAPYWDQGITSAFLTAGTTYFVVLGHWADDVGGIVPGFNELALEVDITFPPANDTCAGAEPLALSMVSRGTTAAANNDFFSNNPSTAACFSGVGQVPTFSGGRDVVYSFEAPAAGSYSFRTFNDTTAADAFATHNVTLWVASECVEGSPVCIKGANRKNPTGRTVLHLQNRAEEVECLTLAANQVVYAIVDTRVGGVTPADAGLDTGFPFSIEVFPCTPESETNDTPATADAMGCWSEGTINPIGDADFWSIGTPAAGSRVFAVVDARQAFSNDFDLRVTTSTDTLEFDADDGAGSIGSASAIIAGMPATGDPLFYRVSHKAAASVCSLLPTKACTTNANCINSSTTAQGICDPKISEPYHLLSVVQPELDFATFEVEPNDGFGTANSIPNGYVYGATDDGFFVPDVYRFCVNKGQDMAIAVDADPFRDGSSTFPQPNLYDLFGFSGYFTGGGGGPSNSTPSPGTLVGTTPASAGEGFEYRARYTGPYWFIIFDNGVAGDYLASIALDCQTFPQGLTGDVSITKTGPTGPQVTDSLLTYEVTITNSGPDMAQDVVMTDVLPPELRFVDISVDSDFDDTPVGDVSCSSLPERCSGDLSVSCTSDADCDPSIGEGTCLPADAPIVCNNYCLAVGSTTTYFIQVRVRGCVGNGLTFCNQASVATLTTPDANPGNNTSELVCGITVDDGITCSDFTVCTSGDHCEGNVCVSTPIDINDYVGGLPDLCTDDFCDPVTGPFHAPTASSLQCDDGFSCTINTCLPATGACDFPPGPDGVECNDFFFCTAGVDHCLAGVCTGPNFCDDGNQCSDDFCDENLQSCSYAPSAVGTACSDTDACTVTACDGANACVTTGPTDCSDGQCCTNDLCDPATGCYYTPNTTPPSFDQQPSLGACAIIWPPQHGYVDFTAANTGAVASHACGIASVEFAGCSSSQPENGTGVGDGNSTRDCVWTAGSVHFRSERNGACSPVGRRYSSTMVATDVCGNSTLSDSFDIGVWHDRGHGPVGMPLYAPVPGSNTNDTRPGNNGSYGTDCGPGTCGEAGQEPDTSDFQPEMEIDQQASITVNDLQLEKASGGNLKLTWTEPQTGINVTKFHVYRQDPVTLVWTLLAEVTKQTLSYQDPVLNDGLRHQYKVTAVIK